MTASIIYKLANYFSPSVILIVWSQHASGHFVDFDMARQQLNTTNQFSVTDI